MNNEFFTDVDKTSVADELRKQGVSEEIISIAVGDIEKGISKGKVNLYATVSNDIERVRYMSEAFNIGASENLVKRFGYIDIDKIELALKKIKEMIPEDVIIKIITKKITTHDMEQTFKMYREFIRELKPEEEPETEEPLEESDTKEEPQEKTVAPDEYSDDDFEMLLDRVCILEEKVESLMNKDNKINTVENVKQDEPDKNAVKTGKKEYVPVGITVPLTVERKPTGPSKGVAAFASKLFGGSSSQESLMSLLIQGRLGKDQLMEIKKAKEADFTDAEVKDLIESGLPAEEMAGIIEVVISEKMRAKTVQN